jgi:DNA uptake protein ComE-like DNA-binding protein
MKAMMEYYGFEAPDSDEIAYAIVDYRDQDDMSGMEPGTYENEYFSAKLGQRVSPDMAADQLAYRTPNEKFLSTDQLLDVYGLDQFSEIYLGYDPAEKEEKDLDARDAAAAGRRVRQQRERKRRGRDPLPIKDIVTVTPEDAGRININTAPVEVLTILIHAATDFQSIEQAKAAAEAIAEFRGDDDKRAPDPEKAFKSIKDVAQVPGVDVGALSKVGSLGVQLSFKSETFRVVGIGNTKNAERQVQAVVQRKLEVYNPDDASLASNRGRGIDRKKRESRDRRRGEKKSGGERADDNYIRIPAVRVLQWIE